MADGELNVDSLITRLLEGECGAGAAGRGRLAKVSRPSAAETQGTPPPPPRPVEGRRGWLAGGPRPAGGWARGCVAAGGQAGPAGSVPADLRGPARRRAGLECGEPGVLGDPSQGGFREACARIVRPWNVYFCALFVLCPWLPRSPVPE